MSAEEHKTMMTQIQQRRMMINQKETNLLKPASYHIETRKVI